MKATGTGNTGWVAGAEADTGLRDVSSLIPAAHLALNPNAKAYLRRVGSWVTFWYANGASPTATGLQTVANSTTLPAGFGCTSWNANIAPTSGMLDASTGAMSSVSLYLSSNRQITSGIHVSGARYAGSLNWTSTDAWPSVLPGSAA